MRPEVQIRFQALTDSWSARFVSINRDAPDRKSEETREVAERLEAILNATPNGIITIDQRGIMVDANPAAHQMFGYTQGNLVGQDVKILVPSPCCKDDDGYLTCFPEGGKGNILGMTQELVRVRKDGSRFPVEVTVTEIPHLGLFVGIYRDITARKQLEQDLDQHRKHLKAMASELLLIQEQQRRQLAEDLHDGLGQSLFRLRFTLHQLPIGDSAATEIDAILGEISKTVNTLTFELSPPLLHTLGLRAAIHWLVIDMKQRYGLSIEIDDDGEDLSLDERVALVLFRSMREVLINIAKHAKTNFGRISMRKLVSSLEIKVEDEGGGFDPSNQFRDVEAGHFGLFSSRERLEYLGGAFRIQSAPGVGTTVILTAPFQPASSNTGECRLGPILKAE